MRFILLPEETELGILCRNMLDKHKIKITDPIIVSNLTSAIKLASSGLGFTFIENMMVKSTKSIKHLKSLAISDPFTSMQVSFAYQIGHNLSVSEQMLIAQVTEYLRSLKHALN